MSNTAIYLVVLGVAMAPAIAALILSSWGTGRRWAVARFGAYGLTAPLYLINALALEAKGNRVGVGISAFIACLAARGVWRTWRAWSVGDYRPQSDRDREAKGAYNAKRLT